MIEALLWCGFYYGLYCIGQDAYEWWSARKSRHN